jgi:hypothetical protein
MNVFFVQNLTVQTMLWGGEEDDYGQPAYKFMPFGAVMNIKAEKVGDSATGPLLRNGVYGTGKIEKVNSHTALWFMLSFDVAFVQGAKCWFEFPKWQRDKQMAIVLEALASAVTAVAALAPLLLLVCSSEPTTVRRYCRRLLYLLLACLVGMAYHWGVLERSLVRFLTLQQTASVYGAASGVLLLELLLLRR